MSVLFGRHLSPGKVAGEKEWKGRGRGKGRRLGWTNK